MQNKIAGRLMQVALLAGLIFLNEVSFAAQAVTKPVSGIVLDESTGKPVANARVRISSPGIDMRGELDDKAGVFDGKTDAQGRFTIRVPKSETISVNVISRGYQEAAGMWMQFNCNLHWQPFPAEGSDLTIKLSPGLYVAGTVTDESGQPIANVRFTSTMRNPADGSIGYVAFGNTDEKGHFRIFAFPGKADAVTDNPKTRGQLDLECPLMLKSSIADVYSLSENERANLHIKLSRGHDISGVLTKADGQPLAYENVLFIPDDENATQKTVRTDLKGRFLAQGLPDGNLTVRAHWFTSEQKVKVKLQMKGADITNNLRLEQIVLKNPPKIANLLGMKLMDETPELHEVYDLYHEQGVIVQSAGTETFRLGTSSLGIGDSFWIVGDKTIHNLQELVTEILRINDVAPPGAPNEGCHGCVRVVYDFNSGAGTDTEHLKLTDADVAELKKYAATFTH